MRIHDIRIDGARGGPREIIVGATTQRRWDWEVEAGYAHMVNHATTLVWVALDVRGPTVAVTETIGLFPGRGTDEREAALAVIPALLAAAWEVVDGAWTLDEAWRRLHGRVL